ncbi:unnamed protein product [Meloidogyne enterolobii]|uniref:Uncharacterized protein n=1 Tax=Meloidogyne enterolobii TaxID=390850 RepID=A0ACB0ZEK8_MELEN
MQNLHYNMHNIPKYTQKYARNYKLFPKIYVAFCDEKRKRILKNNESHLNYFV